mgnify:CR=1 FL=1
MNNNNSSDVNNVQKMFWANDNDKTGILLSDKNIKLHRQYFTQMCKLLGINAIYRAPLDSSKNYNGYGELDTYFNSPELVSCIFDEHTSNKTMRKLGWNAELNDTATVIHVPYDLKGLQAGALFIIPSGLDNTQGRVFKVLRMSSISIYPASIACELGPVLINRDEKSLTGDFKQTNFNMLDDESEDYGH